MTDIGKLRKAVATIEDSEVVFTLEGFVDFTCDWNVRVHFKAMPSLDKSWIARKGEYIFSDDEIREVLEEEYNAFTNKYLSKTVEIVDIDCDHDDDYVYENDDEKQQCDRCEAVLN